MEAKVKQLVVTIPNELMQYIKMVCVKKEITIKDFMTQLILDYASRQEN